jgi:UDP-glucuronate 4-epimerase
VLLTNFSAEIKAATGITADKYLQPMSPGAVPVTSADVSVPAAWTSFARRAPLREGMGRFDYWRHGYFHA